MTTRTDKGFTLLELMVVMGIMVLISTIVVSGYFGMSRASAYIAARTVVYGTLQNAAQRACLDGRRVVVAFIGSQKGSYEDNALVAIEVAGVVTEKVTTEALRDRTAHFKIYTDTTNAGDDSGNAGTNSITLWNMRNGARIDGFTFSRGWLPQGGADIPGPSSGKYQYEVTELAPLGGKKIDMSKWRQGDQYGFQISDVQYVPKGFKIGFDSVSASPRDKVLVFEPDGTGFVASSEGMNNQGGSATLFLSEKIKPEAAIKVTFRNGKVTTDAPVD